MSKWAKDLWNGTVSSGVSQPKYTSIPFSYGSLVAFFLILFILSFWIMVGLQWTAFTLLWGAQSTNAAKLEDKKASFISQLHVLFSPGLAGWLFPSPHPPKLLIYCCLLIAHTSSQRRWTWAWKHEPSLPNPWQHKQTLQYQLGPTSHLKIGRRTLHHCSHQHTQRHEIILDSGVHQATNPIHHMFDGVQLKLWQNISQWERWWWQFS